MVNGQLLAVFFYPGYVAMEPRCQAAYLLPHQLSVHSIQGRGDERDWGSRGSPKARKRRREASIYHLQCFKSHSPCSYLFAVAMTTCLPAVILRRYEGKGKRTGKVEEAAFGISQDWQDRRDDGLNGAMR